MVNNDGDLLKAEMVSCRLGARVMYTRRVRHQTDEETSHMAIQSHLAELERRHQALENEINDAFMHPSTDDLRIAELKRRKLQLKDEITRLRHENLVSVH
jgi:hypothetical protein